MPGLLRAYEGLGRQAREEHWTHEEFLHEVLAVEVQSRSESAVRQRIRDARFPEPKTLDTFDFNASEGIDAAQISDLARGKWIADAENLIFAGPIGTGKTHLAIALGMEAARQRRHVGFWRAADLVRALLEARDNRELTRLQRRLARLELLILDELGFVPFDRTGGELLFNLVAERYERRSVLVTSNLSFSEWPKVFGGDEKLTTALLDRLAHHAAVITTKGKSFRMRRRQATEAGGSKKG
jgi:DNA replication protein DnaC